ncbi:MAG: hypothetical protein JWO46_633 [Nocardioidaceae bacterium]|nr:hypothetical protein [Nocardioidaceae bacterium]
MPSSAKRVTSRAAYRGRYDVGVGRRTPEAGEVDGDDVVVRGEQVEDRLEDLPPAADAVHEDDGTAGTAPVEVDPAHPGIFSPGSLNADRGTTIRLTAASRAEAAQTPQTIR